MKVCFSRARASLLTVALTVFTVHLSVAQTGNGPKSPVGGAYRIAGVVVSKTDGNPLAGARVLIWDINNPHNRQTLITSDNGKFEFRGLAAGKFSLEGVKRGFIYSGYNQHEQFWTAIVTGAGLDTENLVLRLAPAAVISGTILDESGDPVRGAEVTIYFDDHSLGTDQIHAFNSTQSDDRGIYEFVGLKPGTYFLGVRATPWYAVHPTPQPNEDDQAMIDRSLDVAYPLTYYPDVTDADSAMPVPIRGGERLQIDVHLSPLPALHIFLHLPIESNNNFPYPQLEQRALDGSTFLPTDMRMVSPGIEEISGVPAGKYDIRTIGAGDAQSVQISGVDLTADGEELDTSGGEVLSMIKVSAKMPRETKPPPQLTVGLHAIHGAPTVWQQLDSKGEAEFRQLAPGLYEISGANDGKPCFIADISSEGKKLSGRILKVPAAATIAVSLTLANASSKIQGTAKRTGNPFAGAMVVLVPNNPAMNQDAFRRDQSDLDGTFSLPNVVPGAYTIVAIEDGWDLDWSKPGVIAAYLKRGQKIKVTDGQIINLDQAVEVQSKSPVLGK